VLAEPYETLASMRAVYPDQSLALVTSIPAGPAAGVLVALVAVIAFVAIGIGSPVAVALIVVIALPVQAIRRRLRERTSP
jgi:hypothetical protein